MANKVVTPPVDALRDTEWLARRLGLSVSTIERLRAQNSPDIPAHVTIGRSIRYHADYVERWIAQRLQMELPGFPPGGVHCND